MAMEVHTIYPGDKDILIVEDGRVIAKVDFDDVDEEQARKDAALFAGAEELLAAAEELMNALAQSGLQTGPGAEHGRKRQAAAVHRLQCAIKDCRTAPLVRC